MTKESKAVIGGTEEVSLHIRQRCVVLRFYVEGPNWTASGFMAKPSGCCFLVL